MTEARETKKKPAAQLEPGKAEEVYPDESRGQHYLLQLQRSAGNRAVVGLLESHGWVQTRLRSESTGDELEHDADVAATQVMQLASSPAGVVQRKCATCTPASKCADCADEEIRLQRKPKDSAIPVVQLKAARSSATPVVQRAPRNGDATGTAPTAPDTATENAPEPATSTAGPLLVDDDAPTVAPGQMRKTEFLEQLRSTVCTTADEALAEAGQTTQGCPYIEKWLGYYEDQPPAHIERALRKYAPEAATAASAHDYIPAVSNRVRRAVQTWAMTGEITGVPDEMKHMLSGPGAALGAIGGVLGAIGGAISAAAGAIGGAFSTIGKALFKHKDGHSESNDPEEIQTQLSGGHALDGGAQARMGAAFGHDFSDVRVHTDSGAAGLSDRLNARAFTVGSDIAFSAGEYRPGTLIGDALIAHELAHVVQQRGGVQAAERDPLRESPSLETEADDAAVAAILSVQSDSSAIPRNRLQLSSLKTGLRLQRCGGPYSDTDLQEFLKKVEKEGVQRGFYDDDRARDVVRRWKEGGKGFDLTPRIKNRLIQGMLDGDVGGDDERGILDLLEFSDNGDLRLIFAKGEGVSPLTLDKEFDGDNLKELLGFYEERFTGGRAALVKGDVAPKGSPKKGAPHFPYSWESFERRLLEIPYRPEDVANYVHSLPPAEQVKARTDLNDKRAGHQKKLDDLGKIIGEKTRAALAKAGKQWKAMSPKEQLEAQLDAAPNEMFVVQDLTHKLERFEAVLSSIIHETAKRGVEAATAEAVAPRTQAEKEAVKSTVKPAAPGTSAFTDKAGYESALRAAVVELINHYHKKYVQDVSRTDLNTLERLAQIANKGRDSVNDAFGAQWGIGPEFQPGVNLIDLHLEVEQKVRSIPPAARPPALKEAMRGELRKWMAREKDLREVNRKFKANPKFTEEGAPDNDEAHIQVKIANDIGASDTQRIFEIVRGWPGSHFEGVVKLQTPKKPTGPEERQQFWKLYQTSIHEYIHSLMNGRYRTYAESFPGGSKSREFNTLVEGVASVFHEMVWQSVQSKLSTKELRDVVEGPAYAGEAFDASVIPDIKDIRYGSFEEAQALIARVGIANVMLAFFKGRIDLIGG